MVSAHERLLEVQALRWVCADKLFLLVNLANTTSAILFDTGPVSPGDAKVRPGMEYTWPGCHGCVPIGATLTKGEPVIFAIGEGG